MIHCVYKFLQAAAYTKGAYTVVYPVVRGTGPLFTVIGAYLIFNETFSGLQWMGVAVLMAGIFGLALYNMIYLEAEREYIEHRDGAGCRDWAVCGAVHDAGCVRHSRNDKSIYLPGVVFHDRWFFIPDHCLPPLAPNARCTRCVAFNANVAFSAALSLS